jgi:hypothetical protein
VRRVQDLRKTAGLDIADRIAVRYRASEALAAAVAAHAGYIQGETLTVDLGPEGAEKPLAPDQAASAEDTFDGETLTVRLARVASPAAAKPKRAPARRKPAARKKPAAATKSTARTKSQAKTARAKARPKAAAKSKPKAARRKASTGKKTARVRARSRPGTRRSTR